MTPSLVDACETAANAAPGDTTAGPALPYRLHFEPLTPGAGGVDIPCDGTGRVPLDTLGEKLRNNYFFARACIGRLFAAPTVCTRPAC